MFIACATSYWNNVNKSAPSDFAARDADYEPHVIYVTRAFCWI